MAEHPSSTQFADVSQDKSPLLDISRAVLRHRRRALACLAAIMTLTLLVTWLMPKAYRSEAKLLVRLGRENATLDPTVMSTHEAVMTIPQSREDEINSIAEIIGSRVMLEQVVDAIGPGTILGWPQSDAPAEAVARQPAAVKTVSHTSQASTAPSGWLPALPLTSSLGPRDRAIIAVQKSLRVAPIRKSNIIDVTYEAESPQAAQDVVTKLVECYIREHTRLNRNAGACRFLGDETVRLREELQLAEDKLCDLKNKAQLVSSDEQRKVLAHQIGALEDELRKSQAAAAVSEKKIALLQQKLAETPEREVSGEMAGVGDMGTENMRGQMYALQLREKQVAASHTDAHPQLQEVRRQVAEAKEVLAQESPTRRHVTMAPSRARQQLESLLLAEQPLLAGYQAEAAAVDSQLADARRHLQQFNRDDLRIASLARDVELLESSYRRASTNLQQARIDESQANERISNINLAQPASLEAKPVRPRVGINLALGLVAGCCAGVAVALASDRGGRSRRDAG